MPRILALLLGLLVLVVPLALAQQSGQQQQGNLKDVIEKAGEGFRQTVNTGMSETWRYATFAVGIITLGLAFYAVFIKRMSWTILLGEAIFLAFLYGLPHLIGAVAPFFDVPSDKVAEWQCNFAGYIFYEQFCGGGGGTGTPGTSQTVIR